MYGESIKIQLNKIYMNRTRKYLLPIIKIYGTEFTNCINNIRKVAVGIGDMIVQKCGYVHEKHLFILADCDTNKLHFERSIEWLRNHPALVDDYVFGNIQHSHYHMLVIEIPEQFIPSLQHFKEGKFSKMYSKEDINRLFTIHSKFPEDVAFYKSIHCVLTHDHNYKIEFAKQVTAEFGVKNYNPPDDIEFDFPIVLKQEVFNMK